ncbi:hypothetical protein TPHA_0C03670 [Tetrapisispora phaffii CBS 4417]|uniref:LNS2/PITP domain-containing protein n=1 Tax=Tetrapisispora phaffii (strain ATCC 24235 / CBS 4417 / NBRC 1672 / NRRL Y-8282 / UCD 70-5) TaxID=1071381 RepID=G8BQK7_TETPH|nr:hypothetical protein TPHA_0C03670 [Tetrapisispora phaffii CBS 4417]CCE62519.1 hypothetical protein TPHA_0C03670 [Tetrapisispora phaffii CBS 4417]
MQYVGRAIGVVSKNWSSINPATLSGAIDVIVVEHPDGTLACSPFHVRFGKFRILKPSQKKVQVIVNGKSTNIPMKLSDNGEAYFVFSTGSDIHDIPDDLLSSPVLSATSSPPQSPHSIDANNDITGHLVDKDGMKIVLEEPDFLDINMNSLYNNVNNKSKETDSSLSIPTSPKIVNINKRLTDINIPSKIDYNGDLVLDIEGYKPDDEKMHDTDEKLRKLLQEELGDSYKLSNIMTEDKNGNLRISNPSDYFHSPSISTSSISDFNSNGTFTSPTAISTGSDEYTSDTDLNTNTINSSSIDEQSNKVSSNSNNTQQYIRTIRLTSDQLKCLDLRYGENDLEFSVDKGKAIVRSKLFVWRWDVPIVISDIDGTITKSDALGHVMTMIGKDWTHIGVAKLFTEISRNGYNIMYLTARSSGQSDSTRSYLESVEQNGCKLPNGPVILSPDRTMAALRREVILKKPELFKIACLNDIRSIYVDKFEDYHSNNQLDGSNDLGLNNRLEDDFKPTPFVAGFGNRITDALSYRTVGIPSSRIFTINPDGEVHMELLELAGYKSSYVDINELVDQFFPPVKINDFDSRSVSSLQLGSPLSLSVDNMNKSENNLQYGTSNNKKNNNEISGTGYNFDNIGDTSFTSSSNVDRSKYFRNNHFADKYNDVNFWREPLVNLEDLSDNSLESDTDLESDHKRLVLDKKSNNKKDRSLKINKKVSIIKGEDDDINFVQSSDSKNKNTPTMDSVMTTPSKDKNTQYHHHNGKSPKELRKEEIGNRIYLELGSAFSSPRMSSMNESQSTFLDGTRPMSQDSSRDDVSISSSMNMDRLTLNSQKNITPTASISKIQVNVLDNGETVENNSHGGSDYSDYQSGDNEEATDDEFDEDDFVE